MLGAAAYGRGTARLNGTSSTAIRGRRASNFFPTRAAAAAEREKLQAKLDLAKRKCSGERRNADRGKPAPAAGAARYRLSPQSIVLRCRVTPPFAELRQMLLVDEIDPGLHVGVPALDQEREFADQPSRAKPVE
jgi:hypothetical protein